MLRSGLFAIVAACGMFFVGASDANAGGPCRPHHWHGGPAYPVYYGPPVYRPYVRPYFAPRPVYYAPGAAFYYGPGFHGPRGGLWIGF